MRDSTYGNKTYSDLISLPTFEERVRYAQLLDYTSIGGTFGEDRWMNQKLYHSWQWQQVRREVILRDCGNELAFEGRPIKGKIIVHHLNPITVDDFEHNIDKIFDMENLVTVSFDLHNVIHFCMNQITEQTYTPRRPGDLCPWK